MSNRKIGLWTLGIGLFLWVFFLTNGAFFGSGFVQWLYRRSAWFYDWMKHNTPEAETEFLGEPIGARLAGLGVDEPLVLDVATGTGRVLAALLRRPGFRGTVVGLDFTRPMLDEAAAKLNSYGQRVGLVHHTAAVLPFRDGTFDVVTSAEATEFMPDPRETVREMARVLKPGGLMAVTNRTGFSAALMPGKVEPLDRFMEYLRSLGLTDVSPGPKQRYIGVEFYTLVFARKPGVAPPNGTAAEWREALRCGHCDPRAAEVVLG